MNVHAALGTRRMGSKSILNMLNTKSWLAQDNGKYTNKNVIRPRRQSENEQDILNQPGVLDGQDKYEDLKEVPQLAQYSSLTVFINPSFEGVDSVQTFRPFWPIGDTQIQIKVICLLI